MEEDRFDLYVMGRNIGKYSGWDQADMFEVIIYDFVPIEGVWLPLGSVSINYETGTVRTYSDEGEVLESVDLIEQIKHLPPVGLA